jgi:hypothetical protein
MKFLLSSSIDTERFEADSVEEAVKIYKERLRYRASGSACKDQYLCLVIAVHAEWYEHPRQERDEFTVVEESVKALKGKYTKQDKNKKEKVDKIKEFFLENTDRKPLEHCLMCGKKLTQIDRLRGRCGCQDLTPEDLNKRMTI